MDTRKHYEAVCMELEARKAKIQRALGALKELQELEPAKERAEPIWPPTPDKPAPEGATFEKGATLRNDGCFNAYTIDVTDHGAKIQVFGDPELRDRILRLLQDDRDAPGPKPDTQPKTQPKPPQPLP